MVKKRVTQVEEVNYGLYLWMMPDGIVADEDGNYLNIASIKGDIRKINKLKEVAKSYGLEEGKPLWFSGHRRVTDEEYQEQKDDWITHRKGGYDTSNELFDSKGNVIDSQ